MKIAISAESTIDMPKEMLEEYNINTIPFTILLGENAKLDGQFDPKEIFEYVLINKTLPKTSAVNEFQFSEYFNSLLKEYDGIIHISLSSEMSSAYSNACKVASELDTPNNTNLSLFCFIVSIINNTINDRQTQQFLIFFF